MLAHWYVQVFLISLIAGGGLVLFVRYPWLKKYIPFILWVAKTIRISVDHWNARKAYKDAAQVLERYTILVELYSFSTSSEMSEKWFAKFVRDTYERVFAGTGNKEEAERISNAMFTLLVNHKNVIESLQSLHDPENIDVQRMTLIFIDFLGEFFTLTNKTDRLFYEQMVVGINRVLLKLKSGGWDKKTINDISAILWRMFQLVRAYKQSLNLTNLSRIEFEKKMQDALSILLSYFK